jgi:hypothetical protein
MSKGWSGMTRTMCCRAGILPLSTRAPGFMSLAITITPSSVCKPLSFLPFTYEGECFWPYGNCKMLTLIFAQFFIRNLLFAEVYLISCGLNFLWLISLFFLPENLVWNGDYMFVLLLCRDLGNAGIAGPLIPDLGRMKNLQFM